MTEKNAEAKSGGSWVRLAVEVGGVLALTGYVVNASIDGLRIGDNQHGDDPAVSCGADLTRAHADAPGRLVEQDPLRVNVVQAASQLMTWECVDNSAGAPTVPSR